MTSRALILESYCTLSNPTHTVQLGLGKGLISGQIFCISTSKTYQLEEKNMTINDLKIFEFSSKQDLLESISRTAKVTFTCIEISSNTLGLFLHTK